MQTTPKKGNHMVVEVIMLVGLVIMAGVLYFIYSSNKSAKTSPTQTVPTTSTVVVSPEPTSTPIPPSPTPTPKSIPHGKIPFSVSIGSDMKGPRMGAGSIDPYDPAKGGKQQVTIEIGDKTPIQKVVAILKTDNKTSPAVELKPLNGATNQGNWQGEWIVDDTYLYTYILTIRATSASGTSYTDILLR